MSDHYLKVVLKENANVLDCLRLSSQLETNDLVEETQVFLDAVIEIEDQTSKPASLIQWRLKKKLQDTIKMLALLRKREKGC